MNISCRPHAYFITALIVYSRKEAQVPGWTLLGTMAYSHCRTRIQVPIRIQIPNPMAILYYMEHVYIIWTETWIPIQTWIPNRYSTHFTARKRSLRRLCFHRCLSVRGGCGRHPTGRHPPGRPLGQTPSPSRADTHQADTPQLGYSQQVGGTHPTGMHSCWEWYPYLDWESMLGNVNKPLGESYTI